ncbi:MAG: molybdopterin-dependent oxidoreductase [Spirochaetales bacterium]|nr:molybdopterin-dependent oxidoreductase [Spirochaetales bacterium]
MKTIKCVINGKEQEVPGEPKRRLLDYLREELGLMGSKNGCNVGHCGTCTVIIDGKARRSCAVTMASCENKTIETIESLSQGGTLHPLQFAFIEEGAVQCGFCTPGMIMSCKALLDENPSPTEKEIRHALRHNICRCTGYEAIFRAVKRAAALMRGEETYEPEKYDRGVYVGLNVPKKDGVAKVTGAPIFADDLKEPAMLYGVPLFSEHAHARILSVKTDEAQAQPGVVKVATEGDVPGINKFGLFVPQQPVICGDRVKYFGDVVACVYGESLEAARLGASKISVEYEVLPAQIDAEENFKADSPLIHEGSENNIVHHVSVRKGDVEKGFAQADFVVENVYQTQAVEHAYLEPESCLAKWQEGVLTLYSGSQGSLAYKKMIRENLNLEEDQVRVVFMATGGGFGGKEEPTVQILAALGTQLTDRPVKMVMTREDSIRMSTKRHPMKIWMKHGVTKDGRITAMTSRVIGDAGAYVSQTNPVIFRSAVTASGPYNVENVEADSYGVYTHKNPHGAFRGFGSTQASFACESQMDQLAEKIGMDPYELRRKNGFAQGVETSTGQLLQDGVGYLDTLKTVHQGLEEMKEEYSRQDRPDHIKLGFGLASAYKNVGIGTGLADKAGAYVELTEEGRILVSMGATDMGQGVDTLCAQIAGSVLDLPYGLIDVIACDTLTCPDGGMTTASRQTYVTGNAVKEAALMLRDNLIDYWKKFDTPSQDCLKSVYTQDRKDGVRVKIEHDYYPPKTYAHRTDANFKEGEDRSTYDIHYSYCFASAALAVEVNEQTGEVKVLKVYASQDVGKAIHPKNVIGQIEGAVAMGIGLGLSEEFVADGEKIHHRNLRSLGLLTSETMPPVVASYVEEAQEKGPFGAKGMGEVGLNPVAPALANAIYDATGKRLTHLPMKADKVLRALQS